MGNNITRSIKQSELKDSWVLLDAKDVRFGKLATKIVKALMGKDNVKKVNYLVSGSKVVVINVAKISFYPSKLISKLYPQHSGFPGGFKELKFKDLVVSKPEFIVKKAVWGMLPKNKMGRKLLQNLYLFNGPEHKFTAQNPTKI